MPSSFVIDQKPYRAYLRGRGVSDELAAAARLEFLSAADTHTAAFVRSPSIRIPYHDPKGAPTGFARYRLLDPSAAPDGRKFTQRRGEPPQLYLAPGREWSKIAKDAKAPLVITEGEIKALVAAGAGLNAVAVGGVDCWRTKDGPLAEWKLFKWAGRRVELAFDADAATKPAVRRALLALADYLASLGAAVFIKALPDVLSTTKTGLDDLIAKCGVEAYAAAPAHARDSAAIAAWRAALDGEPDFPPLELRPAPAAWFDEALPPPEFTVEPLIPARTVVILTAEGGTGKTSLALRLGLAVAGGEPFFGLATKPARVVFLALEDPVEVLRRRVQKFHQAIVTELRTIARDEGRARRFDAKVRANFVVESLAGRQLHLVTLDRGVVIQSAALDTLIARLRESGGAGLVVLDPLSRIHGADENSNSTGTAIINAAERIAAELGCAVLISHHTGKAAANAQSESMYAARGASGIADAARVGLRLRAIDEKEAARIVNVTPDDVRRGVLRLVNAKNNYAPRVADLWLKRTEFGDLEAFVPEFRDAEDDFAAFVAKLRAWAAEHPGPITKRAVEDVAPAIFNRRVSRAAVRRFFDDAIADGTLVSTGDRTRGGGTAYALREVPRAP